AVAPALAARASAAPARDPALAEPAPQPDSAPRLRSEAREPRHIDEPAQRHPFQPRSDAEQERFEALCGGDAEAGHALCQALAADPERVDDLAAASLVLSRVEPGSRRTLELLERAAKLGGDLAHAHAIAHVLECSSAETVHAPPPLERQHGN